MIQEALSAGCRLEPACKETQISLRTYRRWVNADGHVRSERRLDANRSEPKNKLSTSERQRILEIGCLPEYASLPPAVTSGQRCVSGLRSKLLSSSKSE
ncbi:MAG: hypothetical protein KAG53_10155 [Endozoicomonadaceae bacterium]|nr:hypothetical protein [Endozoicomonadaceae bacterium]